MVNSEKLIDAIREYYETVIECNKCTDMIISTGRTAESAELMQKMYKAQSKMFRLAGIDYFGGYVDK